MTRDEFFDPSRPPAFYRFYRTDGTFGYLRRWSGFMWYYGTFGRYPAGQDLKDPISHPDIAKLIRATEKIVPEFHLDGTPWVEPTLQLALF